MEELILYVFVNTDLKMRMGCIAAQVGHVIHKITDTIVRDIYETVPMPEYCDRYLQWCKSPTTVVLRATQLELQEIVKQSETCAFYDDIDSKQELTAIGLFPNKSALLQKQYSKYKLL